MKILILLLVFSTTSSVIAQNIYKAERGKVSFFSGALLENIEATTTKTTAALNASTGEVAVLIPIKSFEFDKALMREHFNENYLESDKYPDASFKGKIAGKPTLTPRAKYEVTIGGELLIHGVSQHRDITATLNVSTDGTVLISGKFNVKVADHKVKVPSLVFQNIAEIVEVSFAYTLKPSINP